MLADYTAYAERMGVLEVPPGYNVQRQVLMNVIARQLSYYWWVLVLAGLLLSGLIVLIWRFVAARMRIAGRDV
jgi:arylsulfatase/uncharacterized sulfatase